MSPSQYTIYESRSHYYQPVKGFHSIDKDWPNTVCGSHHPLESLAADSDAKNIASPPTSGLRTSFSLSALDAPWDCLEDISDLLHSDLEHAVITPVKHREVSRCGLTRSRSFADFIPFPDTLSATNMELVPTTTFVDSVDTDTRSVYASTPLSFASIAGPIPREYLSSNVGAEQAHSLDMEYCDAIDMASLTIAPPTYPSKDMPPMTPFDSTATMSQYLHSAAINSMPPSFTPSPTNQRAVSDTGRHHWPRRKEYTNVSNLLSHSQPYLQPPRSRSEIAPRSIMERQPYAFGEIGSSVGMSADVILEGTAFHSYAANNLRCQHAPADDALTAQHRFDQPRASSQPLVRHEVEVNPSIQDEQRAQDDPSRSFGQDIVNSPELSLHDPFERMARRPPRHRDIERKQENKHHKKNGGSRPQGHKNEKPNFRAQAQSRTNLDGAGYHQPTSLSSGPEPKPHPISSHGQGLNPNMPQLSEPEFPHAWMPRGSFLHGTRTRHDARNRGANKQGRSQRKGTQQDIGVEAPGARDGVGSGFGS